MSETSANENQQKVAVLIDGENVSSDLADLVFSNAATFGFVVVREIYGTATALTSWIQPVLKYAIHPNLTVKASKSKNSSDISLVIGAMDLLSYREIGTVIIVSSDSDFSALSVRLRSGGINVVGMGAEKANPLWRTACSSFVVLNEKKTAMQTVVVARPAAPAQRSVSQPASAAPAQRPAPQSAPVVSAQRSVSQPVSAAPVQNPAPQPAVAHTAATTAQPVQAAAPAPAKNPTHEERLNNIRNRIAALLKADNGRMPVTKLFQNLNRFHDYQVDQAGSKRKPLTYLMWAFGNTFFFEETPSGVIVSLEPSPAAQEKNAEAAESEGAGSGTPVKVEAAGQKDAEEKPAEILPVADQEKSAETAPAIAVSAASKTAQTARSNDKPTARKAAQPTVAKAEPTPEVKAEAGVAPAQDKPVAKARTSSTKTEPETKKPVKKTPAKTKSAAKKSSDRTAATAADAAVPSEASASAAAPGRMSIEDVKAIPARIRKALAAAGHTTLREAAQVSDAELQAIPQVGVATIASFRKTVKELLG